MIVPCLPLASTRAAVIGLITVEVSAGMARLLMAALAGILVVGRTLRPLTRVAATAARVTQAQLASGAVSVPGRVAEGDTDPRTEVGRVGGALNRLLDHVEDSLGARQASERQVRQFVADASHELRTPLASVRGYAELLRRQRPDGAVDGPGDLVYGLRRIETEALRMSGLVDDLLPLARLDTDRALEMGTVDLTALLIDAVSDAHAAGPGHVWRLDVPAVPVLAHGDAVRLQRVIANLLTNVRTHTPPGTTATAHLRAEHGKAVLQVLDDGLGIPPALLDRVFERFARGDASRSRADGNTGLGLAIVEAIIAAHDGSVAAESRPGRSVFTVRLPASAVDEPDDAEDERALVPTSPSPPSRTYSPATAPPPRSGQG